MKLFGIILAIFAGQHFMSCKGIYEYKSYSQLVNQNELLTFEPILIDSSVFYKEPYYWKEEDIVLDTSQGAYLIVREINRINRVYHKYPNFDLRLTIFCKDSLSFMNKYFCINDLIGLDTHDCVEFSIVNIWEFNHLGKKYFQIWINEYRSRSYGNYPLIFEMDPINMLPKPIIFSNFLSNHGFPIVDPNVIVDYKNDGILDIFAANNDTLRLYKISDNACHDLTSSVVYDQKTMKFLLKKL